MASEGSGGRPPEDRRHAALARQRVLASVAALAFLVALLLWARGGLGRGGEAPPADGAAATPVRHDDGSWTFHWTLRAGEDARYELLLWDARDPAGPPLHFEGELSEPSARVPAAVAQALPERVLWEARVAGGGASTGRWELALR